MTGWRVEADFSPDPGILTGRYDIDMDVQIEKTLGKMIEIAILGDLERHPVEPGRFRFTQDYAMTVKLVERLKEGPPAFNAHQVQTNPVTIMLDRLVEVQNPQLHIARANHSGQSHFSSPCLINFVTKFG